MSLNAKFWRIILASWTMMEIDDLGEYAKDVERVTQGW